MKTNQWFCGIVLAVVLFCHSASAVTLPARYSLDAPVETDAKLPSNSIIDIKPLGSSLWLGTGRGLGKLHLPDGEWTSISEDEGIGRGGISALAVADSIIWSATAYSEKIEGQFLPAGGGVGYSRDSGVTWTWMAQPVDTADVDSSGPFRPTTTNIQNVTYDIALSDSAVWITSWGGGLRRLKYGAEHWEVVSPDSNAFSALLHLNHRAFSVVFSSGSIWAGTAAGINRSDDEGETWTRYQHEAGVAGSISGNFVTALAVQQVGDRELIWAATWRAESVFEYYGVSVTENKGQTWRVALSDSTVLTGGQYLIDRYGPLRVHNFGFKDSTVYAAADDALWVGSNFGTSWSGEPLVEIYDASLGEALSDVDFYSAASTGDSIWVGTDDGLAVGWADVGAPGGFIWRIHRAHTRAGSGGEPQTFAYPNPFSPRRGHITSFQLSLSAPATATLGIWNFAMEPVLNEKSYSLPGGGAGDMAGYAAIKWDGRDSAGNIVANGVYFYRLKVGGEAFWGKIMVLD